MTENNIIIALVGMPGSGKTSAADFFEKRGFVVLRLGDQTDVGLKEMGLPINEKNEKMYREKIRKELGMAAMAIKIKPRINQALKKNHKIILDGLYSWEEYFYLKKFYRNLFLLCIYARPKKRYLRLSGRKIRGLTEKQAQERDYAELEKLNKGGPIAIADYLIENNNSKKEFNQKIEKFLNSEIYK